jgi:hypothetical protein
MTSAFRSSALAISGHHPSDCEPMLAQRIAGGYSAALGGRLGILFLLLIAEHYCGFILG